MSKGNEKKKLRKNIRKNKNEKELEQEALREEGMSIFVVLGLTILFITIGIILGYYLYKLALSSSGVIINYGYLLK